MGVRRHRADFPLEILGIEVIDLVFLRMLLYKHLAQSQTSAKVVESIVHFYQPIDLNTVLIISRQVQ
jgi:hypothetical protein